MLLASERDFPEDYNPPARLARAYFEMKKRLDDAKAATTRVGEGLRAASAAGFRRRRQISPRRRGTSPVNEKPWKMARAHEKSALNDKQKKPREPRRPARRASK